MQESELNATPIIGNTVEKVTSWEFDWTSLIDKSIEYGTNLLVTIAILIIGFILAKRITRMFAVLLKKKDFDSSLQTFLFSMVSISLKILVVLTALGQLGIEMTSFIALVGAAGLAVGMAFSGTLGNFAGGIMILIFKPYKVGDYIKAQGEEGTVNQIQIFNTILLTSDNKTIIIPNGTIANGNMTNYTVQMKRRVDVVIGIAYGGNYDTAKRVLQQIIAEDDKIFKDGTDFIGIEALAGSSVNIKIRVWCKTEDYWDVFFRMNERIYKEFGQEGLNMIL